jgi:hypothetical protein
MSKRILSMGVALALLFTGGSPQIGSSLHTGTQVDPVKPKIGKSSKHTVKFSGVLKARRIAKTRKNIRKHASKRKY